MHLLPEKLGLQLQFPIESHTVEVDPILLHSQAKNNKKMKDGKSKSYFDFLK